MTIGCFLFGAQVVRARDGGITGCWNGQGPEGSLGLLPTCPLRPLFLRRRRNGNGSGGDVSRSLVGRGGGRHGGVKKTPTHTSRERVEAEKPGRRGRRDNWWMQESGQDGSTMSASSDPLFGNHLKPMSVYGLETSVTFGQ